jgi:hypothetical protein
MTVQTLVNCEDYAPFLYEGTIIVVHNITETEYCGYYDIGFGTTYACVPKELCVIIDN